VLEVCLNGDVACEAKEVDVYANCFVKRDRPLGSIETVSHKQERIMRFNHIPLIFSRGFFGKAPNNQIDGIASS
jgi:hypothetical protein